MISSGQNEFAKLVTNHVLGNIYGNVSAAIMNSDGETNHLREDGGTARPGLDDGLIAGLVNFFNLLKQACVCEGPFLIERDMT